MRTVHDFQTSLAKSQEQADAPWWELVYRKAFPNFMAMHSVRNDGWAQRGGIDRVVLTAGGKQLRIDEKVRAQDYPDILLEFYSDVERKTPGWVAKDLACDFIAYAFVPSERCYLLPFQTLRRAWKENCKRWVSLGQARKDGFGIRDAVNTRHVTRCVSVPIPELLSAITDAIAIRWGVTAVEGPPDDFGQEELFRG